MVSDPRHWHAIFQGAVQGAQVFHTFRESAWGFLILTLVQIYRPSSVPIGFLKAVEGMADPAFCLNPLSLDSFC